MKVLILGKNGMLGHKVYNYFKNRNYEVKGTTRNEYEVDKDNIEDIIKEVKPDVVINCIGILNKQCEDNKLLAIKVNTLLPHQLDYLSDKYNYYFIQVSTDCVFNGKEGNYIETSIPNAESFYGRTKALGEINNNKNVTLRTSIIGPDDKDGIGLFQWFMKQKKEVNGYSKVIWTGITTIELAKQMEVAINNHLTGIQHVVNNDFISKKDLLELFKKYYNKDINIIDDDSIVSNKTLIRTNLSYNFNIPSYEEMIERMF